MKVGFFHDAPLVWVGEKEVFSTDFTHKTWQRYLSVFDELLASTRKTEGGVGNLGRSSGPLVSFQPIEAYRSPADLLLRIRRVHRQVSDALGEVDCAIVRLPSIIGWIAWLEARRRRVPVLVELVGCPWDSFWNHGLKGRLIAPLAYCATRWMVSRTEFVIYVTKAFLQGRYPTNGQSVNVSNVNVVPRVSDLDRRLSRARTPGARMRLGSIGKVDLKYKGHHLVVQALAQLGAGASNITYELVGGGEPRRLRALADHAGVAHRVFFHGKLPSAEVAAWLDSLDVYVQPSLSEGLPRSVIEAMSRGLPVIGADAGGIPELLDDDALFSAGSMSGLAARIAEFRADDLALRSQRNFSVSKTYELNALQSRRETLLRSFRNAVEDRGDKNRAFKEPTSLVRRWLNFREKGGARARKN